MSRVLHNLKYFSEVIHTSVEGTQRAVLDEVVFDNHLLNGTMRWPLEQVIQDVVLGAFDVHLDTVEPGGRRLELDIKSVFHLLVGRHWVYGKLGVGYLSITLASGCIEHNNILRMF